MSDALKPCPFCGERPQLTVRPDNADATTYFAAVVCYCDSYSACAHKMATAPEADEAEAAARAAWNRRAALSAPPPVVPAGWQLVPVEPHPRLLNVLFGYWLDPVNNLKHRAIAAAEWRSMLTAAPQAPTQREGD